MFTCSLLRRGGTVAAAIAFALVGRGATAGDPFADEVIAYVPGADPAPGYTISASVLGSPERFTGEGAFPGVVSIYNAPFLPGEIVSIGAGGSITVRFDTPVTDDPANPYGIDLLVFSNAFFVDDGTGISALFGEGGGIEVSPDNARWASVGAAAEGLFPTQGYLDAGPYDLDPGRVPSDFTRPVNPCLTIDDFTGLTFGDARGLYLDSGGGAGVDLAGTGFAAISYVRIANGAASSSVEIDALADVAPTLIGDVDRDGDVDIDDIVVVIVEWGPLAPGVAADINGDCAVDIDDLVLVVLSFR